MNSLHKAYSSEYRGAQHSISLFIRSKKNEAIGLRESSAVVIRQQSPGIGVIDALNLF